jgi:hypothetical protein
MKAEALHLWGYGDHGRMNTGPALKAEPWLETSAQICYCIRNESSSFPAEGVKPRTASAMEDR